MQFFLMIVVVSALLIYVLLDGYDLGIGVLTLFQPDAARRRQMLEVVGNVWDGNESWLILLAMGLWGVMPDAFATALARPLHTAAGDDLRPHLPRFRGRDDAPPGPLRPHLDPPVRGRLARRGVSPRASCSAACCVVSPSATSCSPARRGTSSGTATGCSPAW